MNFNNLLDLATKISTEAIAISYFIKMRWNDNITCPYKDCVVNEFKDTKNKIYVYKNGKDFKCSCCKKRFSYKIGTVVAMVNRDTKQVKTYHTPSNTYGVVGKKIIDNVELGSTVITDEASIYNNLHNFYNHKTVNHSNGEYVKKDLSRKAVKITTNSVGGFFSVLKRGIYGTYHWVSKKHLQNYLNEFSLRYNSRFLKKMKITKIKK